MHTYQLVTTFKERLSELCFASGQTDSDLAKDLGISKQTLSAWKCGTRSPKGPTIETIARYFGVPVDWLLGFDVPKNEETYEKEKPIPEDELDEEIVNLLQELADLTPDERAQVRGYIACLKAARAAAASRNK